MRTMAGGAGSITETWRTLPLEPKAKLVPVPESDGLATSTVKAPPGRANGPGS